MKKLLKEKTRKPTSRYQENGVAFLPVCNPPTKVVSKMRGGISYDLISSPILSVGLPGFTVESSWHMLSPLLF